MAILKTCEPVSTCAGRPAASQRQESLRQPAATRNTSRESDRYGTDTPLLRVLVVGTEQDASDTILRQVRRAGYFVHSAAGGLNAIRAAVAGHPDVVLLDMKTLQRDACQVAKQLRSNCLGEDCLVIAFADWVDSVCYDQCMEAGIDLVLIKPVATEVVETLLMLECVRVNRRRAGEAVNTSGCPTAMDQRPGHIRDKPR